MTIPKMIIFDYGHTFIEGSAQVGIFPVWYDNSVEGIWRDKTSETVPQCEHLHIKEWDELIELLEDMSCRNSK